MTRFYLYTFENNMYNVQSSIIGEGKTVNKIPKEK